MKLLHGNTRSHIHCDVLNWLREEDINIMPYSEYSPDCCTVEIISSCSIQGGERNSRGRIFQKLLEKVELCTNNHGAYFEHLMKQNSNFLCLYIFLFKFQSFWLDLSNGCSRNNGHCLFRNYLSEFLH